MVVQPAHIQTPASAELSDFSLERSHISILSLLNYFGYNFPKNYILREGPWDTKQNRNSLKKIH